MPPTACTIARMSVILVVSIGASSLLGGCCCPTDRQVVRSPAVAVQVVDDESGEPVEGARVQLCRVRIGPPPDAVVDRWNKTTDSDGRVSFAYRATEETVMPLMMHGVPQRGWILCAEHPDHGYARGPSRGHLLVERGSTEVTPREVPDQTIELAPRGDETRPCDCDALPDETDGWE